MKQYFIPYLCLLLLPTLSFGQDYGGDDKLICQNGTTQIGTNTSCSGCCYKWAPAEGLDNPTSATPNVSGLDQSMIYSVTVSLPNGDYVTDEVSVYIYTTHMSIYKPLVFTYGVEEMVPEDRKKTIGAQTMVNVDNDDKDEALDIDDPLVKWGDDEFIKIKVSMKIDLPGFATNEIAQRGPIEYAASIELMDGASAEGTKIWRSYDKGEGEYLIGEKLQLSPDGLDTYEGFLWVEGIKGQTEQRLTKLYARAYSDPSTTCDQDEYVSLTILDVTSITWEGIENGYTGDGQNNSNTLDPVSAESPNQRVFPEKKFINGSMSDDVKNKVKLIVELSTEPVEKMQIGMRTFDIDDPSDEIQFIDPNDDSGMEGPYLGEAGLTYTKDDDNRGAVELSGTSIKSKHGDITGAGVTATDDEKKQGIYWVTTISSKTTVDFTVSTFPGDNFRVVVNSDANFLFLCGNIDKNDKDMITAILTGEVRSPYVSPILAVFRTLHIEVDGMKPPSVTANDNQDVRNVILTDFKKGVTAAGISEIILKKADGTTDAVLIDGSGPPERFQGGYITIGNKSFDKRIEKTINGQVSFTQDAVGFPDIFLGQTCEIKKVGQNTILCSILDITKSATGPITYTVKIENTPHLSNYSGGTVSISLGGPVTIDLVISDSKFKISSLKIPVGLRDDDDINALSFNFVSSADGIYAQAFMKSAFRDSYIDPVVDGGGNPLFNNNISANFKINLENEVGDVVGIFDDNAQSKNLESPSYWVAYLLIGWQTKIKLDRDPDIERGNTGVTPASTDHCLLKNGGPISFISMATAKELNYPLKDVLAYLATHEIGHQFALTHLLKDSSNPSLGCAECLPPTNLCKISKVKIMHLNYDPILTNNPDYAKFGGYHINLLRSRYLNPNF